MPGWAQVADSGAMDQEIALVRSIRERICPDLARQAEAANARDLGYVLLDSFDFAAWNRCRHEAEQGLRGSKPTRYRNQKGFLFYTQQGAGLAEQADQLSLLLKASGCP